MLHTTLERLAADDYEFARDNLSHARTNSDVGFIAELFNTRKCRITGKEEDTLNAFFFVDTPTGRRYFTIPEDAGMTPAEFKAVTRADLEEIDRQLPPI